MNKTLSARAIAAAIFCFLFIAACTRPDPFGSDLFQGDEADLELTDTLTLEAFLLNEDSVSTSLPVTYLMGKLDDAVFGQTEAIVNTLFKMSKAGYSFGTGAQIDSVRMYVGYDAAHFYGDSLQAQTVEIYRLAEDLSPTDTFYSNKPSLAVGAKIGEATFAPRPRKEKLLLDTSLVTVQTDTTGAFFEIALDNALGADILALDSLSRTDEAEFFKKIKGLQIRSTTASSQAIFSLDLDNADFSRITLFYHLADGSKKTFHLYFRANKFVELRHDRSGAAFQNLIGKRSDSLLYLQGAAGLKVRFNVPHVRSLQGSIINKAELVLTVADASSGSVAALEPVNQFILVEKASDSSFVSTSDLLFSLGSTGTGGFGRFGGTKTTENGLTVYRMNLSDRLQAMIEGRKSTDFYLKSFPQDRSAERTVLNGPKASNGAARAKIVVKYTRLR